MDWVTVGVSIGGTAVLMLAVVGLYFLLKKKPEAGKLVEMASTLLPVVGDVAGATGLTHDVLNLVKHTSKTASFLLENKDKPFDEVKDEMKSYVKSVLAVAGKEDIPDDVLDAELVTAYTFMKNSLG